jgi:nitrite reductase/ring-hydroxylating ferredoxin subunit/uncharacterized membrane protein
MDSEVITAAVTQQDWLGPVADTLQTTVGQAYKAGGPAGQKIANILHGVWLGHSLHPVLTDIPLGAWTVAAALDLMEAFGGRTELGPGADAAVGVGLAGALGAAASGLTDWYILGDADKSNQRVGAAHALLNVGATALYGTSWLLRRGGRRGAGRAVGWLGFAVVSAAAYLGGALVSENKLSVDHATRERLPTDFVSVLPDADLSENTLMRVEVNGVKILLVRRNGQLSALGELCSHLGGPLAEGKLDGDCVVCPWHASKFALSSGEVVDGPATFPQPRFETRVQNGQIEVRAPQLPQNGTAA